MLLNNRSQGQRTKEKEKKLLLWQKEETYYCKDTVYSKQRRFGITHKTEHRKGGRKHDYKVYKHNHPVTPSQVENVFDLGLPRS